MYRALTVLILGVCIVAKEPRAHHSRVEFSGDDVEIRGELTAINWRNPHPTFRVKLLSDDGPGEVEVQVYGAVGNLTDTGVSRELFNVGDRVTIAGRYSSRKGDLVLGTHMLLPSGLEAVLQYDAEPRWAGENVGGLGAEAVDESALARAAAANKGIFRVWSRGRMSVAVDALRSMEPKYTEAAVAARESWDLADNPISRCESLWMPLVMIRPARTREFIDEGDRILLNVAVRGGANRTIYMGDLPESVDRSPTPMGLSTGRWEGDTLVVETHAIDARAFDAQGSLQSSDMRVVERFTLSEDQARLDYEAIMTDARAFESPVIFAHQYLALEEHQWTQNCVPDSQ